MARFELAPWKSQFPFARGGREPYSLFRREFDRLFEDFFGAPATNGGEEGAVAPSLAPRLDIAETETLPTWNPGDEFEAARLKALAEEEGTSR